MRVLGDAAQRGQVAVILRVVDRGGQLVLIKDLSLYPQRAHFILNVSLYPHRRRAF